jgi:hypothetical protein
MFAWYRHQCGQKAQRTEQKLMLQKRGSYLRICCHAVAKRAGVNSAYDRIRPPRSASYMLLCITHKTGIQTNESQTLHIIHQRQLKREDYCACRVGAARQLTAFFLHSFPYSCSNSEQQRSQVARAGRPELSSCREAHSSLTCRSGHGADTTCTITDPGTHPHDQTSSARSPPTCFVRPAYFFVLYHTVWCKNFYIEAGGVSVAYEATATVPYIFQRILFGATVRGYCCVHFRPDSCARFHRLEFRGKISFLSSLL